MKKTYGISTEQYLDLLAKQSSVCAICQKSPEIEGRALAIDHDHKTGEIFGLLCWFCNHRFIGRKRNPDLYLLAAKYLTKGTGLFVPFKEKKRKKRVCKRK